MIYRSVAIVAIFLAMTGPVQAKSVPEEAPEQASDLTTLLPVEIRQCVQEKSIAPVTANRRSLYVKVEDGTKLAVDIFLPTKKASSKLPAVLYSTRYWRGKAGEGMPAELEAWAANGYAVVVLDVRGTGASFGRWYLPYTRREAQDLGYVANWVADQSWSNRKVVATGNSYPGTTALMAPAFGGPAVRAVIPRFSDFDMYSDLLFPGGVPASRLIDEWGELVRRMDLNQPIDGAQVRPVDEYGEALLASAVAQHATVTTSFDEADELVTFKDEAVAQWQNYSFAEGGVYALGSRISQSGVPILGWGSWMDAGIAQGMVNRFANWSNPQISIIGAWTHGARADADPFHPVDAALLPDRSMQQRINICFSDAILHGRTPKAGWNSEILYYVMGADLWKSTKAWPIPATRDTRFTFASGGRLLRDLNEIASGIDRYVVDFFATTGTANRWTTQSGAADIDYGDRAESDKQLLTYTSPPLGYDIEVTGQPVVNLRVASSHSDGIVIVYLEDVAPDGKVTYVTEGELRALHRKEAARPDYVTSYPDKSFSQFDADPLVPGEMTQMRFQMLPVSVLFRKGHRIRIAVAGADKGNFAQIPAASAGDVSIDIAIGGTDGSYISLPIVPSS